MRCLSQFTGLRHTPCAWPGRTAFFMYGLLAGGQSEGTQQDRGEPGMGQGDGIPVPQGTLGKTTKGGITCMK